VETQILTAFQIIKGNNCWRRRVKVVKLNVDCI